MFKRLSLPVLASALILATAASFSASAGHSGARGGYTGRGQGHGSHFSQRYFFGQRRAILRHPVHWRHGSHGVHWRHASYGWHWRHGSHGPAIYSSGYVPEPYPVAGVAATCPGNCLGKEYLQDGSVRFFDRCTQESAIAVPPPAPRG